MVIPQQLLVRSEKVLFIAHLAIGDFTYLQNCFKAFTEAYPHVRVHLWVDETRRTTNRAKWDSLRKNSLYDWVTASPYFEKVYTKTYSPGALKESLREARSEEYPLVISLAGLRAPFYARLARKISPKGFIVGVRKRARFYQLHHHLAYYRLDASIPNYSRSGRPSHISGFYAERFRMLCGIDIPPDARFPFVEIPDEAARYAEEQFDRWGFRGRNVVFINSFATTDKRSWPMHNVAELIRRMQQEEAWLDACFIVNSMPQEVEKVEKMLSGSGVQRTQVFTATNFFRLPAMLGRCALIISVETAVMHLANAVKVPVIALMRTKTPHWAPIDRERSIVITCDNRSEWVKDIGVDMVMAQLSAFGTRQQEEGGVCRDEAETGSMFPPRTMALPDQP